MACVNCEQKTPLDSKQISSLVAEQLSLEKNLVNTTVFQERIAKCQNCSNNMNQTCAKCGCFVEFRCWLANKRCPVNYW